MAHFPLGKLMDRYCGFLVEVKEIRLLHMWLVAPVSRIQVLLKIRQQDEFKSLLERLAVGSVLP